MSGRLRSQLSLTCAAGGTLTNQQGTSMVDRGLWAEPRGAYAILALLALAILGATMAPGGLRDRTRLSTRIVGGTVLLGAALSLLWPQLRHRPALTVDPSVPPPAAVVGAWADGTDTLRFDAGGSYTCAGERCTGVGPGGTWTLAANGALLVRWRDGHDVPWRVVTYHGRHRLALLPLPADGKDYEGRLFFHRVGE